MTWPLALANLAQAAALTHARTTPDRVGSWYAAWRLWRRDQHSLACDIAAGMVPYFLEYHVEWPVEWGGAPTETPAGRVARKKSEAEASARWFARLGGHR